MGSSLFQLGCWYFVLLFFFSGLVFTLDYWYILWMCICSAAWRWKWWIWVGWLLQWWFGNGGSLWPNPVCSIGFFFLVLGSIIVCELAYFGVWNKVQKVRCHAFIGECKIGVIHRLFIECILSKQITKARHFSQIFYLWFSMLYVTGKIFDFIKNFFGCNFFFSRKNGGTQRSSKKKKREQRGKVWK